MSYEEALSTVTFILYKNEGFKKIFLMSLYLQFSRLGYEIYSDQFSIIGVRSGQCLFLWPGHPVEMR